MDNLYQKYALIEDQIKELTAQKEELRTSILNEMVSAGEEKLVTPVGSFSVTKLKTWEYPESVIELGEEYKAAKASAESTGEATYTEKESLRFTKVTL